MVNYEIQAIDQKLFDIDSQIKQKEGNKKTAIVLMIVSIFLLWPLLIVGGIMYATANNSINALQSSKEQLMQQKFMLLQQQQNDSTYTN